MICPKCDTEQPGGREKCPGCDVIFAKWSTRQDWDSAPYSRGREEKPPTRASSNPRLLLLKVAFVLGLAYAWFWFLEPTKGITVPERAYLDAKNSFAFQIPPGLEEGDDEFRRRP
jgi:hypothetical protein